MTKEKLDELERKVNLLSENISLRERELKLSEENKQLKGKIHQLEKLVSPASEPSSEKAPEGLVKGLTALVAAGILALMGYGIYNSYISDGSHYNKARKLGQKEQVLDYPRNHLEVYDDEFPNKFEQAMAELDEVIRLNPKDADAYERRGDFFSTFKEYKSAIRDYDVAIAINPKEELYWVSRGLAHCKLGNNDAGIDDFNKAVTLSADRKVLSVGRKALLHQRNGEFFSCLQSYSEAIEEYTAALELCPNDFSPAYLYHLRGEAWEKKGDLKQSRDDEKRAKELGYHEPEGSSGE